MRCSICGCEGDPVRQVTDHPDYYDAEYCESCVPSRYDRKKIEVSSQQTGGPMAWESRISSLHQSRDGDYTQKQGSFQKHLPFIVTQESLKITLTEGEHNAVAGMLVLMLAPFLREKVTIVTADSQADSTSIVLCNHEIQLIGEDVEKEKGRDELPV